MFSQTAPMDEGFLVGKSSPFDKCFKHLTSKKGGWLQDLGQDKGQIITNSPTQSFPIAQGYLVDVQGNVLVGQEGEPIMASAPLFSSFIVSDLSLDGETLDNRMFALRAPNSSVRMSLFAQNGHFMVGELFGEGFCSTAFPEKISNGRMLVIDQDDSQIDPLNPEGWCIKEYDPGTKGIPWYCDDEEGLNQLSQITFDGLEALEGDDDCAKSGLLKFIRTCDGSISYEWVECPEEVIEPTEGEINSRAQALIDSLPDGSTLDLETAKYILGLGDAPEADTETDGA